MFYVGSIFYNRNFNENDLNLIEEKNEQAEIDTLKNRPPLNTDIPEEDPKEDIPTKENMEPPRESQFEISLSDCNNECATYKEISRFNYCKQVCGLVPISENTSSEQEIIKNCKDLSGLEKDYCWRDEAINETNFEKCQKIEDGNIYKQCKNRITEDIIDN